MRYNNIDLTIKNNGYYAVKSEVYGLTPYVKLNDYGANIIMLVDFSQSLRTNIFLLKKSENALKANYVRTGHLNINVLYIFITNNVRRDKALLKEGINLWLLDTKLMNLMVFESSSADFDNIRSQIEYSFSVDVANAEPKEHYIPYITIGLAVINIIVFLIMVILGDTTNPQFVLDLGGGNGEAVFERGEVYRLFTSMFLHAGFQHIFSNMIALIFIGCQLEKIIGHAKYMSIYLVSGLLSSVASSLVYYLNGDNDIVSVGASGAIFGLFGSMIVIYVVSRKTQKKTNVVKAVYTFVILGFFLVMNSYSLQTDNIAHLSGMLVGAIMTVIIHIANKNKSRTN